MDKSDYGIECLILGHFPDQCLGYEIEGITAVLRMPLTSQAFPCMQAHPK